MVTVRIETVEVLAVIELAAAVVLIGAGWVAHHVWGRYRARRKKQ